jgi:SNF2 family DNA or RNA helicase
MLLIKTNEDDLKHTVGVDGEEPSYDSTRSVPFQQPKAFLEKFKLHSHQERGVQWLQTCVQSPGRQGVLLADDMGVGKTIQILTFLAWCVESGRLPDLTNAEPPFRPILIIVPLILLETRTWEKEMERFFANEGSIFWPVLTLHGADLGKFRIDHAGGKEIELGKPVLDLPRLQRNRVVITNYETVKNYQHSFAYFRNKKSLWSMIISDEAQEYKVPSSKLSHTMKALKADFQIACTGTPVENRLLDLWNICDAIQPGLLSSAKNFTDRFEKPADESVRVERLDELKRTLLFQKTDAFLLRRNKSDVTNLPKKHIVKLSCDMSDEEIRLHKFLLAQLQSGDFAAKFLSVLHGFAQLSQHPALFTGEGEDLSPSELIAGSSKLRTVIQQLHEIRGKREKAIIFARHRGMQSILAKVLAAEFRLPIRIINGDTKMRASPSRAGGAKTRGGILEEFKTSPGFNLIVLSPFVAGIGLTITEANHVIHYGRWWNPAVESQATDRAYRIGQGKEVFVYIPILRDPSGKVPSTFDERLDALMERKYRLAEDFLKPLPPEDSMGSELLNEMRG